MKNILITIGLLSIIAFGVFTQRVEIRDVFLEAQKDRAIPEAVSFQDLQEVEEEVIPEVIVEEEEIIEEEVVPQIKDELVETKQTEVIVEDIAKPEVLTGEPIDDSLPRSINLAVPFSPQAPHANWELPFKEACEETSIMMVDAYYEGVDDGLIDADKATGRIRQLVEFQNNLFGFYEDTTVLQTSIIARQLYGYDQVVLLENPTIDEMKRHLSEGRPLIVPAAGRMLGNPFFQYPGPLYHMLVIKGYTADDEFITNDPGTRRGADFLYSFDTIMKAMHDWNNGDVDNGKKVIMIIYPKQ